MRDLFLLPGLDGTGKLFAPLLAELGDAAQRVVAYPADRPLALSDLAALVLRQLPQHKAWLLAESFSGLVALTLLRDAPSRIGGVIFVGAFAEPPRPLLLRLTPVVSRTTALIRATPAFLLRQYCLGQDADVAQLKMLRDALGSVSPAVLGQRLSLVGARHSFAKGTFPVPALYLRAKQDRLVPPACAEWFRERGCGITDVDAPHFLLQTKPRDAARAIQGFLADARR